MAIRTATLSDIGRVRSANQDACGEFHNQQGFHLLVIADGMGGHAGGEVASQTALDAIGEVFERGFDDPGAMLRDAFITANARIHALAAQRPELQGMGTTGVALLIGNGGAWLANVGDSRVYRVRDGRLEALTEDHSWVFHEVQARRLTPEQAEVHPMRNVLLRSLGVSPSVEVDIGHAAVEPRDRFLLCSDGLWAEVDEQEIADVVATQEPERAARTLVNLANGCGGPDNITVQVVELDDSDASD